MSAPTGLRTDGSGTTKLTTGQTLYVIPSMQDFQMQIPTSRNTSAKHFKQHAWSLFITFNTKYFIKNLRVYKNTHYTLAFHLVITNILNAFYQDIKRNVDELHNFLRKFMNSDNLHLISHSTVKIYAHNIKCL
jgi:hypothetical protein